MANLVRHWREKRGMTRKTLAEKAGTGESQIVKLERGERRLTAEWIERLAKALNVPKSALLEDGDREPRPIAEREHGKFNVTETKISGEPFRPLTYPLSPGRDLEVLGAAKGGMGGTRFMSNGEVFEYVERPTDLVGVNGAYAVYVVGESMSPRYMHGEMVFANPHKPVGQNNFVIVQFWSEDHSEREYTVKQYVRRDSRRLKLRQFNPPEEFDIAASRVIDVHRIVGSREIT